MRGCGVEGRRHSKTLGRQMTGISNTPILLGSHGAMLVTSHVGRFKG